MNAQTRALIKRRIQNNQMICFECGSQVKANNSKGSIDIYSVIRHATSRHMNKFLFKCSLCNHRSHTKNGIQKHLSKRHSLKRTAGKYDNLTIDHEDEIMDTIQRCFGQDGVHDRKKKCPMIKKRK